MFFDYQSEISSLIEKGLKSEKESKKVQKRLLKDFQDYGHQTKLIFGYIYCKNKSNDERGISGTFAGWRYGTISLRLVPDNKIPQSRKPEDNGVRYYDYYRMNWRQYKKNCLIKIAFFWDEKTNDFVENPAEIGLKRNTKNTNSDYKYNPRKDTLEEQEKRKHIKDKDIERIKRQIAKQQQKLAKGNHIIFDIFNMDISELKIQENKKHNILRNIK